MPPISFRYSGGEPEEEEKNKKKESDAFVEIKSKKMKKMLTVKKESVTVEEWKQGRGRFPANIYIYIYILGSWLRPISVPDRCWPIGRRHHSSSKLNLVPASVSHQHNRLGASYCFESFPEWSVCCLSFSGA